jgi:carbon-monoxide dehydrogenase large subunit
MTAHTKGNELKWVGRAIRRLEDPALVTGQGRFTADLPATHWVRFVRSPMPPAKSKIKRRRPW